MPLVLVSTTTADRDEAERIASDLVTSGLAACVQVAGPVRSFYRWQGERRQDEEWVCLVKTTLELYGAVEAAIRRLHRYELPEVVAVPAEGSEPYAAWVAAATTAGDG